MTGYFSKTPIRIPVKMVDGRWEFFYGGAVPVRDGALAELMVQKESITDPKFLRALRKRTEHKLLDEGTVLMVALSVRGELLNGLESLAATIDPKHLSDEYNWTPRPGNTRFVEVKVGPPSLAFSRSRPSQPGGVWLKLEGTQPKGVVVSSIELPKAISDKRVDSLNHTFTLLSERLEPWRQSHTGNIYSRVLYRERNEKWYPLERLRRAAEATEEHALVHERWQELMAMFSKAQSL